MSYARDFSAASTHAQRILDDIADEAAAVEAAEQVVTERVAHRDDLIRAALRTELPRTRIAAAAGVTPTRLYQIRDGAR